MNKKKISFYLVFFVNFVYCQSFDLKLDFLPENLNLSLEDTKYLGFIDENWEKKKEIEPKKNLKINPKSDFYSPKEISISKLRERIQKLNENSKTRILKYNTIVHGAVENYLRMGNNLGKLLALSQFYFPLFEEILAKYDIPEEFKYLAIVESHLDSKAISQMGASGLWQFIPQTAYVYNLHKTNLYDDRNDPIKATKAACLFLKELYDQLGDWSLVLAAYNSGAGTVQKAIKRAKSRDFWFIKNFLPKETQNYIPKFIAINYIMNYYKDHNIKAHILDTSYYQTALVKLKEDTLFSFLEKELEISSKELKFLNPQFLSEVIPKERGNFRLPLEKTYLFPDKEQQIYAHSERYIRNFSLDYIVSKSTKVSLKSLKEKKTRNYKKVSTKGNKLVLKQNLMF